ncbi:MAG TPA: TonB-dependent receptor plug domain-containing protein [Longimicrobiales bacterium]|nr:TonB-dependent receptor plug domain-containing protein [Longimicrobiales bacterium]
MRRLDPMRRYRRAMSSTFLASTAALALAAAPAAAQFPAELAGRVVDAHTSQPIAGATVEVVGGPGAVTDAAGAFLLRAAGEGSATLVATRAGYASRSAEVSLESGRTVRVVVALEAMPIRIAPLQVIARASREGGHVLTRAMIEESGARTLGELVRTVPGMIVRPVAGGGQRASVRGGSADAVLVLVDGVPVNDPLSGEADLSLISLSGVQTVRVLPGARTARYGPRAEAGVILVESRAVNETRPEASALLGSFGRYAITAEAGARRGPVAVSAGARIDRRAERFDYDQPPALGGGSETRTNAQQRSMGGFGALALDVAGAPLVLRADAYDDERGLPGPMHATTPEARQHVSRAGLTAGWRPLLAGTAVRVDASLAWQRMRHEDSVPAFGPAYFDTTRARETGLRVEAERLAGAGSRIERSVAAGAELRGWRLESTTLAPGRVRRVDPSLFARARLELPDAPLTPAIDVAIRADRWSGDWIRSHDVTLHALLGRVALHASHRSGFSPPTASDQFFRSGFAIAPNPDLAPERVPSEIEAGMSAALEVAGLPVELGASAFRGDVDGMIVWAPDFRFVWSPRNRDVRRSGGEAWLRTAPIQSVRMSGWASAARVTYDWPGDADTVQVVYRPRYSGGAAIGWQPTPWRAGVVARFTGVRYATPGHANPLPSYWDLDVTVSRDWRIASTKLTTSLAVERVLDNTDSFVHGYPEPGRRLRLELRLAPWSSEPLEPRFASQ